MNVKKPIILIGLILVVVSCQVKKENTNPKLQNIENVNSKTKYQDTVILDCNIKDTLKNFGEFEYRLRKTGIREYKIMWGNIIQRRTYKSTFECWKTPDNDICDFTPKLERMTEEEVILRVTTSTPSTGNCSPIEYKMIYLPSNPKKEPFEIEYYLTTINNYVVYSNSYDTIKVMNLRTKRVQSIALNPKPYFEFKTIDSSVDSVRIVDGKLFFKYFIGTHDNYEYSKRQMKLNI